jgi:hypothetical protein
MTTQREVITLERSALAGDHLRQADNSEDFGEDANARETRDMSFPTTPKPDGRPETFLDAGNAGTGKKQPSAPSKRRMRNPKASQSIDAAATREA